jgi:hypothetical protein
MVLRIPRHLSVGRYRLLQIHCRQSQSHWRRIGEGSFDTLPEQPNFCSHGGTSRWSSCHSYPYGTAEMVGGCPPVVISQAQNIVAPSPGTGSYQSVDSHHPEEDYHWSCQRLPRTCIRSLRSQHPTRTSKEDGTLLQDTTQRSELSAFQHPQHTCIDQSSYWNNLNHFSLDTQHPVSGTI